MPSVKSASGWTARTPPTRSPWQQPSASSTLMAPCSAWPWSWPTTLPLSIGWPIPNPSARSTRRSISESRLWAAGIGFRPAGGPLVGAELSRSDAALMAKSFTPTVRGAVAWLGARPGNRRRPRWGRLPSVGVDLTSYGGEGGIRTLERAFAPYSLSRRVPSATRPPLRGTKNIPP